MTRFGTILLIAVAAQLVCAPAAAQRTGSRVGRTAVAGSDRDAAEAIRLIADCLADRRAGFVRRWLAMLPGTREEHKLVQTEEADLAICMESQELVMDGKVLRVVPRSLRLPTARAMVRKMLRGAPEQSPAGLDSDPWFVAPLGALPAGADVDKASLTFQDFGHCVAVHAWKGSLALLAARPDSPGEAAAVRQLAPVLGPCLSEDVKITLAPARLRDLLSEPVYHILAAAPAGAVQP